MHICPDMIDDMQKYNNIDKYIVVKPDQEYKYDIKEASQSISLICVTQKVVSLNLKMFIWGFFGKA